MERKSPSSIFVFTIQVVGVGEDPQHAFEHAITKMEADLSEATHGPVVWEHLEDEDMYDLLSVSMCHLGECPEA